jgi:hypothetical protein
MNRQGKINELLARGPDDARRMALDDIDRVARQKNTFGSKEHREARERVEKRYDADERALERLSDDQLDAKLGTDLQP